jgi:hypothetical protein
MPFQPGFRGKPLPPAVWQQSAAFAFTTNLSNVAAPCNFRALFPQSFLTITGGSKVRLTLTAGVAFAGGEQPLQLDEVWFGQASASYTGSSPNFASTPQQVKFAGSAACTVALGGTIVTDDIIMSLPVANGVLLSGWSNRNYTVRGIANASASWSAKAGASEAGLVTVTAWSFFSNQFACCSKIEVFK